jgi:hypothetical protein
MCSHLLERKLCAKIERNNISFFLFFFDSIGLSSIKQPFSNVALIGTLTGIYFNYTISLIANFYNPLKNILTIGSLEMFFIYRYNENEANNLIETVWRNNAVINECRS